MLLIINYLQQQLSRRKWSRWRPGGRAWAVTVAAWEAGMGGYGGGSGWRAGGGDARVATATTEVTKGDDADSGDDHDDDHDDYYNYYLNPGHHNDQSVRRLHPLTEPWLTMSGLFQKPA